MSDPQDLMRRLTDNPPAYAETRAYLVADDFVRGLEIAMCPLWTAPLAALTWLADWLDDVLPWPWTAFGLGLFHTVAAPLTPRREWPTHSGPVWEPSLFDWKGETA